MNEQDQNLILANIHVDRVKGRLFFFYFFFQNFLPSLIMIFYKQVIIMESRKCTEFCLKIITGEIHNLVLKNMSKIVQSAYHKLHSLQFHCCCQIATDQILGRMLSFTGWNLACIPILTIIIALQSSMIQLLCGFLHQQFL